MSGPKFLSQLNLPIDATNLDPEAFDQVIRAYGVPMIHYQSMRSPVGMIDRGDIRKPEQDYSGSSNGFIYRKAGVATGMFTSNNKEQRIVDLGELDGSTAFVTLPRYYDGTDKPVKVCRYDRFYISDEAVTVPNWQLFTANAIGMDRMTYPVIDVDIIIDHRGNEYFEQDHFVVDQGQVRWTGAYRPDPNSTCSIRYSYRPYWYVSRIQHEVRLAFRDNVVTGERKTMQMPRAYVFQREYLFENEPRDSSNPEDPRQVKQSPSGSFGPR